ncbi:hypothetical protein D3C77_755220 [compost metagenome]
MYAIGHLWRRGSWPRCGARLALYIRKRRLITSAVTTMVTGRAALCINCITTICAEPE